MADQETTNAASGSAAPLGPEDDQLQEQPERERVRIAGLILILILAVALFFLIRGCDPLPESSSSSSSYNIDVVSDAEPIRGAVSVWVEPDTSIQSALQSAGVASGEVVDLGDGRYVVDVPEGTEVEAARALVEVAGVYDAGLVYEEGGETPDGQ